MKRRAHKAAFTFFVAPARSSTEARRLLIDWLTDVVYERRSKGWALKWAHRRWQVRLSVSEWLRIHYSQRRMSDLIQWENPLLALLPKADKPR